MSNSRWPLVWALNSLHPLASGSHSQPIPSPPKIVRPSFRCSARRQHRRLPTGRKVLPYPVGDFGRPFVPAFDRGISYFRQRGNPEVGLTLTNKHPPVPSEDPPSRRHRRLDLSGGRRSQWRWQSRSGRDFADWDANGSAEKIQSPL